MSNTPIMDTSVDKKIFERIAVCTLIKPFVKSKKKYKFSSSVKHIKSLTALNYGVWLKILSKKHKLNFLAIKDNNAIYCPDQYIGILEVNNDEVHWKTIRSFGSNTQKQQEKIASCQKTIAVVIESPHKYEFYFSKNDNDLVVDCTPVGPAMGNTGCNLLGYLSGMIYDQVVTKNAGANTNIKGEYKVVLVNAIQYQCSLGEDTSIYRDDVFRAMWNKSETKNDFETRLKSHNADVVINACTKGNSGSELRNMVADVIKKVKDESNKKFIWLKCGHPSSWHNPQKRKLEESM